MTLFHFLFYVVPPLLFGCPVAFRHLKFQWILNFIAGSTLLWFWVQEFELHTDNGLGPALGRSLLVVWTLGYAWGTTLALSLLFVRNSMPASWRQHPRAEFLLVLLITAAAWIISAVLIGYLLDHSHTTSLGG